MAVDCLREGTFLDNRYRIKKVLGVGGFGITYLTEDHSLAQYVSGKRVFPFRDNRKGSMRETDRL